MEDSKRELNRSQQRDGLRSLSQPLFFVRTHATTSNSSISTQNTNSRLDKGRKESGNGQLGRFDSKGDFGLVFDQTDMTRPLRPSMFVVRQRLSRGGSDRPIIHVQNGSSRTTIDGNRTTDGVVTASGPKHTEDGTEGVTLGDRVRGRQGSTMDTTLKADPALLIDPDILTDIGPTDRQTEVTHQLSRTGSRESIETL